MPRFRFFALAIVVSLGATATSRRASAWTKPGHMVTGAIAYQDLKASGDDAVIAATVALLKSNPNYDPAPGTEGPNWRHEMELAHVQPGSPDEAQFLFMEAARWADDIRGTREHCGKCHYIDYIFRPGQGTENPEAMPQKPNAETAFADKNAALSTARYGAGHPGGVAEPAKDLTWIFHLVGDIHQPLHAASLVTSQRPDGDQGGNQFFIRPRRGAPVMNLHSYWDGLLIGSTRFGSVRNRAGEIRAAFPRTDLTLTLANTDFHAWATKESFPLAARSVYLNGLLNGALPRPTPVMVDGHKDYTPDDAPALPDGYAANAKKVAYERAALTGYRLADLLRGWNVSGRLNRGSER